MIIVKNGRSPVRIPGTWGRVYRIGPYFDVTEIRTIEADKLLRRIRKRQRESLREGGSSRRVTTGLAGHCVMRDQHSVDTQ